MYIRSISKKGVRQRPKIIPDDDDENERVSCLNELGEPVDWFFHLKRPKGFKYLSYTSKDNGDRMHRGDNIESDTPLKRTLEQYYGREKEFISLMFNDDLPEKEILTSIQKRPYSHAKGVIHCKGEHCYFLQHSWPRFPPSSNGYKSGAKQNGQHFLCISLKFSEVDPILRILYHIRPKYYAPLPAFNNAFSVDLQNILARGFVDNEVDAEEVIFFSGQFLRAFYKNYKSKKVIYDLLKNRYAKTKFDITTWLSGKSEPINYSEEHPNFATISKILQPTDDEDKASWNYGSDHSKISLSRDPNVPIICFGDLNFVMDKTMRAGALYCFENANLYAALRNELIFESHEYVGDAIMMSRKWG